VDITVHCPQCGSRYRLKPEMRGKRTRCPNAVCRAVFEVRDEAETPKTNETPVAPQSSIKAESPAEPNYRVGAVGDMVPLLTVENVDEPPPAPASPSVVGQSVPLVPAQEIQETGPKEAAWQQAPPPRRQSAAPAAEAASPSEAQETPPFEVLSWQAGPPPVRQSDPAAPVAPSSRPSKKRPRQDTMPAPQRAEPPVEESTAPAPTEVPPGSWEPPPVRRPKDTPTPEPARELVASGAEVAPSPTTAEELLPAPARRKKNTWIMAALLLLVAGVVGGGGAIVWIKTATTEEEAAQKAKEAYDDANYPSAARLYGQLRKRFAQSERLKEYEFWEDFSQARSQVKALDVEADAALDQLRAFLRKHDNDPLLKQFSADVWDTYGYLIDKKLLPEKIEVGRDNLARMEQLVSRIDEVLAEAEAYAPANDRGEKFHSSERLKRVAELRLAVKHARQVEDFLARAGRLPLNPESLRQVQREAEQQGLDQDPAIVAWIRNARAGLGPTIPYVKRDVRIPAPEADRARSLLVARRVDRAIPDADSPPTNVVFALARGILYALAEDDGRLIWAERVGIDTTTLPLRLPKSEANLREWVLVLSSDTNTLTARDALTGDPHWQYNLGSPCLGRPVLVKGKAYIATVNGRVHEIEIVKGQFLGSFEVGDPLTGAGARQEGTNLVYFPTEGGYVIVLDVEKHKCVAALPTGHPAGSLRGEPILTGDNQPGPGGTPPARYLILSQTDGLDAMKLRTWRLSLDQPTSPATPLLPEPRVRGWSWFQSHCDGEKIVLATDAGILGLFGINQFHNADAPLFPLLPRQTTLEGETRSVGRAQVVLATENDFWVLAQGQLQHYRLGLAPADGPRLAGVWPKPLVLGSPLHAAQLSDGHDTLFVVTQAADRPVCLATAVDTATGKVRWQRQLGLSGQDDVVPVGDLVAVFDPGGLFLFDPKAKNPLLPGSQDGPVGIAWAQATADGQSAYALGVPTPGKLALRRYTVGTKPGDVRWKEITGALGGTPALTAGNLVLPLADGTLLRQGLAPGAVPEDGPHWRAPHADVGAVGHVVALGGSRYLYTDGSRGLRRLSWPEKGWETKGEPYQLENRIVAAPLALPASDKGTSLVCVADAAGQLILLDAVKLEELHRWTLGGKVTAGPFRLGRRVGCIMDRRRIVCIDPAQAKPLWQWTATNGEGLVGRPLEVGGSLVVADLSGRYVALDPETGKPSDPGYALKTSAAPSAAPLAFGADHLFAPLTDGTVLLLSLEQLINRREP
jgi:outer membrane protein assembly factor BamB